MPEGALVILLDERGKALDSQEFAELIGEHRDRGQRDLAIVIGGADGLDPDLRFDKHKAGIQANRFVLLYGQRLLPALYERYNPMSYKDAQAMEIELGIHLRAHGYGVWQG